MTNHFQEVLKKFVFNFWQFVLYIILVSLSIFFSMVHGYNNFIPISLLSGFYIINIKTTQQTFLLKIVFLISNIVLVNPYLLYMSYVFLEPFHNITIKYKSFLGFAFAFFKNDLFSYYLIIFMLSLACIFYSFIEKKIHANLIYFVLVVLIYYIKLFHTMYFEILEIVTSLKTLYIEEEVEVNSYISSINIKYTNRELTDYFLKMLAPKTTTNTFVICGRPSLDGLLIRLDLLKYFVEKLQSPLGLELLVSILEKTLSFEEKQYLELKYKENIRLGLFGGVILLFRVIVEGLLTVEMMRILLSPFEVNRLSQDQIISIIEPIQIGDINLPEAFIQQFSQRFSINSEPTILNLLKKTGDRFFGGDLKVKLLIDERGIDITSIYKWNKILDFDLSHWSLFNFKSPPKIEIEKSPFGITLEMLEISYNVEKTLLAIAARLVER